MERVRPIQPQIESIHQLYQRSRDDSPNYRAFRKRFRHISFQNIFGGTWHGMFIGIETDGYRHS